MTFDQLFEQLEKKKIVGQAARKAVAALIAEHLEKANRHLYQVEIGTLLLAGMK